MYAKLNDRVRTAKLGTGRVVHAYVGADGIRRCFVRLDDGRKVHVYSGDLRPETVGKAVAS